MDWQKFNYAMGHVNNSLQFVKDMLNKDNGSVSERLQEAGTNLFGNTVALRNAANIRRYTGSNLGYAGFYAAGGNAERAVTNTSQSVMFTSTFYSPMGSQMLWNNYGNYGCYQNDLSNSFRYPNPYMGGGYTNYWA